MTVVVIIGVIVAIFFFMAKAKANARMTYADTQRAIRKVEIGTANKMPSWSYDETDTLVFFDGARRLAERGGVHESYIHAVYSEREPSRILLLVAGEMESEGRSFTQQQLGVSELLDRMWGRLPESEKRKYR